MKSAKAVVAAIGSTITALMTALATVSLVLDDDAVDVTEIGTLTTAVVALGLTIWAVWRVPNAGYIEREQALRTGTLRSR